jgi:uncharacterized membrane protein YcaP (DUF421 family)
MMTEILLITGRTLIAIVSMFFLTKLLGKRQLSEISLFGYISGISIGNIAAYIALENEKVWLLGIISLCLWVLITVLLERLTLKSKKLRGYVDGDRRLLIKNGIVLKEAMAKEKMTVDELLEQLRDRDVYRIADIENASIEANGQVSVLLKAQHLPLTPAMLGLPVESEYEPITVITDGSAELETMKSKGIDLTWLNKQLATENLKIEDVFIAQYIRDSELSIHTLDHRTITIKLKDDSKSNQLSIVQLDQLKKSLLHAIALIEQQTKKST